MRKIAISTFLAAISIASVAHAEDAQVPGFMIANYTIKDVAGFKKYMEEAGPLAPKFGGKIIVFNMNANAVEGQPEQVMAIAEFPSVADAHRFYDSPEYIAARKYRVASTVGSVIITEGFVPTSK